MSLKHLCANHCPRWTGEQCNDCLVRDELVEPQNDFKVGDVVVVTNQEFAGDLLTIDSYLDNPLLLFPVVFLTTSNGEPEMFGITLLRHATAQEIEVGHRIDETEEVLAVEAAAWRECREPCRFDQLEAPAHTDLELMQKEMLLRFQHDRNYWCAMFWLALIGYGIAFWWVP